MSAERSLAGSSLSSLLDSDEEGEGRDDVGAGAVVDICQIAIPWLKMNEVGELGIVVYAYYPEVLGLGVEEYKNRLYIKEVNPKGPFARFSDFVFEYPIEITHVNGDTDFNRTYPFVGLPTETIALTLSDGRSDFPIQINLRLPPDLAYPTWDEALSQIYLITGRSRDIGSGSRIVDDQGVTQYRRVVEASRREDTRGTIGLHFAQAVEGGPITVHHVIEGGSADLAFRALQTEGLDIAQVPGARLVAITDGEFQPLDISTLEAANNSATGGVHAARYVTIEIGNQTHMIAPICSVPSTELAAASVDSRRVGGLSV
jgi:hypothetical protein